MIASHCFRCANLTTATDGICEPCVTLIQERTARRARLADRRPRVSRRTTSGPLKYLTADTPGRIKAERWFTSRPDVLVAVNAHPSLQQRCAKYGLTVGEWMVRVADQKSRCAICETEIPPLELHVDHDHYGGHVRGLLCPPCNMGLGHLGIDGPLAIDRATAVLRYARASVRGPFQKPTSVSGNTPTRCTDAG